MSVHVLTDTFHHKSVMYCSTTGRPFGPVFNSEDAGEFVDWLLAKGTDPRELHADDLAIQIEAWENEYYAVEVES